MYNVSIVNAGYKQTNISEGNQLFPIKIQCFSYIIVIIILYYPYLTYDLYHYLYHSCCYHYLHFPFDAVETMS